MKPRHARSRQLPRVPGPIAAVSVLAAFCLLSAPASAPAQEIERLVPAESPGPAVDLWIENSHPDLDFGYWVSDPAYVAVFQVIPGVGTTLVLPERDGPRDPVEVGRRAAGGSYYASLRREGRGSRHALDTGLVPHARRYGAAWSGRAYLLLVASRTPLHLWSFTRLDDYRHAARAGERTPYAARIRTTAERLIELVVASPEAGGWSAAYLPYALRAPGDRFAFGPSIQFLSLCAYGFPGHGFLPVGSYGYGGYGIGFRSGHRGLGRALPASGIGLWSHPFGFGDPRGFGYPAGGIGYPIGLASRLGFGSPYGSRSYCGYDAPTLYRLGLLRFRDPFFPPRPIGPPLPPVSDRPRTTAIPPPGVYRKPPTPTLERPAIDAPASNVSNVKSALEKAPVPVRRIGVEVERATPALRRPAAPRPRELEPGVPTPVRRPTAVRRPSPLRPPAAVPRAPTGAERRSERRSRSPASIRTPTRTRTPHLGRRPRGLRSPAGKGHSLGRLRTWNRIHAPGGVTRGPHRMGGRSTIGARPPMRMRSRSPIRVRSSLGSRATVRRPARPARPLRAKRGGNDDA